MKKVFETKISAWPISLSINEDSFLVEYGAEKYSTLNLAMAAKKLGDFIIHSLEAEGAFEPEDNEAS